MMVIKRHVLGVMDIGRAVGRRANISESLYLNANGSVIICSVTTIQD